MNGRGGARARARARPDSLVERKDSPHIRERTKSPHASHGLPLPLFLPSNPQAPAAVKSMTFSGES